MAPLEDPEQLENLLAGYVLGNLTPAEAAQVKQLLECTPSLLTELDRLQSTLAVLPLSLPITVPCPQLEDRILQAAQAEASRVTSAPAKPVRRMGQRFWQWGVAVAALMVVGLSIETYRLHQQLTTAQTTLDLIRQAELLTPRQELSRYQATVNLLLEPNNRFLKLIGTHSNLRSSGSLVIVPTKESAILILRDVPPLPKGKVYRLWALAKGKKVTCGDFQPNAQGEVFVQLPLAELGKATEVVVTVEPDQALPEPVGEMVIIGS
jgi:anti-sigma-K factor RskA